MDRRYQRWRWQIFGITWLAYAGYYLTRKAFSVAKNELKKPEVLGLSKADMSWMDGAYSGAYALGQVVWGAMGDKLGARRVLLGGMLASVLTAAWMGWSKSALMMGVLFAFQGLWQASGWPPLSKNMGAFFSRGERGSVMGLWCTNYAIGGFIASVVAGYAASWWGWQFAFFVPAALLLGIAVLFYFLQRDRPEDVGLPPVEQAIGEELESGGEAGGGGQAAPRDQQHGSWHAIAAVLRNRMVWFLAAVYFLVKPTRYLLLFWSPVYISERLGTDTAASGLLSSMFDLAGPLGTLAGGIVSDRLFQSRRMPVAALALATLAGLMIILPKLPLNHAGMGLAMFVMGFLALIPDSLISGAAAIDFGTKHGAATSCGLINGCGSVGQMIGVMLPGSVEAIMGSGRDIWSGIFVGLGISLALAAALLMTQWNRMPGPESAR